MIGFIGGVVIVGALLMIYTCCRAASFADDTWDRD